MFYICSKCKQEKDEINFTIRKDRNKRKTWCRECSCAYQKEWSKDNKKKVKEIRKKGYLKNHDKILQRHLDWYQKNKQKEQIRGRKYYHANREKYLKKAKEYRKLHKDKRLETERKWRDNNKDYYQQMKRNWWRRNSSKVRMYYAKRVKYIARATPKWADLKKIEEMYIKAAELTKKKGIEHHVDHIIPLTHKLVCGLHVHNNLQILTASENHKKSNKFKL